MAKGPPPRRRPRGSSRQPCMRTWVVVSLIAILVAVLAWFWQKRRDEIASAAATAAAAAAAAQPLVGALEQTVYDRGLVSRQTGARSVLHENRAFYFNVTRRVSPGRVLGFVTPWSSRGEETAWRFASKLTHLCPVMYTVTEHGLLRARERESWLASLREGLSCPSCPPPARLVPLVSLEGLNMAAFFGADDSEEQAGRLLVSLLAKVADRQLDGYVLDAHAHLATLPREVRRKCAAALHVFVQLLAQQLSQQGAELVLLVPPHPDLFGPTQFEQLAEPLGGIVVATTNFSAIRGQPGPTAPLGWMRDALAALRPEQATVGKLMATMPWLGWDFQLPEGPGVAVDGDAYRTLLETHRPERFDWHAEAAEHVFSYKKNDFRHSVYYPSLKGLAERLGVLRNLGVGVAIWEMGTGLDYFFDLL